MNERKIEALTADAELWESRKLGASAQHVKVVSNEEEREIDAGLGLQLISIRLNYGLIEQLKSLSKLEGIGYQPLIRQILTKYVKSNEHKLDLLLSVAEAAERAEQLFSQAMKYKSMIPTLTPLSNKRIETENDYTTALRQANSLFMQAYANSSDLVLKRHLKLRLDQISNLVQKGLQELRNTKISRKRKHG